MPQFGVATKAVVFNVKTKRYLVLRKSSVEDINPDTFDIPGGRIRFGEQLTEAVVREVKEETGLDVKVGPVLNAWTFVKDSDFQLTGIDFLCLADEEEVTLSEEHSAFEWLKPKDVADNNGYPQWLREVVRKADKTCLCN